MYGFLWQRVYCVRVTGRRLPGAVDCALNVLSDECGEEITGYVRTLASRLHTEMGCTTR